jgi:hypothetical protein
LHRVHVDMESMHTSPLMGLVLEGSAKVAKVVAVLAMVVVMGLGRRQLL